VVSFRRCISWTAAGSLASDVLFTAMWIRSYWTSSAPGWISVGITKGGIPAGILKIVPYWLLIAPSVLISGYWLWLYYTVWRPDDRTAQNRCFHCGYDLRSSSYNCPECGTPDIRIHTSHNFTTKPSAEEMDDSNE
jgi:predicted RNA-binding Zn-ribbon protein involved in translation (DUF1610 family)